MKSKAQVIKDNENHKILINAVIRNLGDKSYISDVNSNGMAGGFPGFTYYSDTHKFAMRYRKQIIPMLEQMASDLGEELVTMISSFGVFRGSPMDDDDKKDLYKYLGDGRPQQGTITNVMAWFAAEEVCRMFED